MLGTASDGSPVGEGFEVVAIFPGKLEEFAGVEMRGFIAQESFKAPLDVRTVPGLKAVSAGGKPVEFEDVPHRYERKSRTASKL
jgi:hypothetical protein